VIQQMQQQVQQQQQLVIGTRFKELGFNVNSGRINGIHQTRDMLVAQLYHAAWPEHIDVMLDVPEKY
jgi:hypothetical protein